MSHESRAPRKTAMRLLISAQIIHGHGFGQGFGLVKTQAQPFTGNGVHATGGVANQRNIAAIYASQTSRPGYRASHFAGQLGVPQSPRQFRKFTQRGWQAAIWLSRYDHHANFMIRYRG